MDTIIKIPTPKFRIGQFITCVYPRSKYAYHGDIADVKIRYKGGRWRVFYKMVYGWFDERYCRVHNWDDLEQ